MTHEERMSRAGDYVLGLMDDHERQRAERDLEVDTEFRDCVVRLAERFRLFHSAGTRNDGRDAIWAAVEARLSALPQMSGLQGAGKPASGAENATAKGEGVLRARPVGGWWIVAAACLAAAASLGYGVGRTHAPPGPEGIAVLDAADGQAKAIVETYGGGRVRVVPLTVLDMPEGGALALWLSSPGEDGLFVGAVDAGAPTRLTLPGAVTADADRRYEIASGSSTEPRGDVLLTERAAPPRR